MTSFQRVKIPPRNLNPQGKQGEEIWCSELLHNQNLVKGYVLRRGDMHYQLTCVSCYASEMLTKLNASRCLEVFYL